MEYLNALQSAAQQLLRDESAPLPGLQVLRSTRTTPIDAVVYHPVVCLILQGEKVVSSGTHSVSLSAGQALLVSHDLPVVSKITRASARQPYLALVLALDIALARSLAESIGDRLPPVSASQVLSCQHEHLFVSRTLQGGNRHNTLAIPEGPAVDRGALAFGGW